MPRNSRPKLWLPSKPVLLTVVEKTVPTDGRRVLVEETQTTTMTDTPTMCHQTDDVVEQRDEADAEGVQQAVEDEHDAEDAGS